MTNKLNDAGLAIIKHYESLQLAAYKCPAGVLTIGYGHTGKDVEKGQVITEAEALALLAADLEKFEAGVAKLVQVELTNNQFSALVSLAFNIGLENLAKSELLALLNEGHADEVTAQFLRWNKAKGVVLSGLVARRAAEAALFARVG